MLQPGGVVRGSPPCVGMGCQVLRRLWGKRRVEAQGAVAKGFWWRMPKRGRPFCLLLACCANVDGPARGRSAASCICLALPGESLSLMCWLVWTLREESAKGESGASQGLARRGNSCVSHHGLQQLCLLQAKRFAYQVPTFVCCRQE